MADKVDVTKHVLVPKHVKATEKEKKALLDKYDITEEELAKIKLDDPAIQNLKVVPGDVIKIVRHSPTAGETEFYRCVVND